MKLVIRWNNDLEEFQVGKGEEAYFTNDYMDALGTAQAMAKISGARVVDTVPHKHKGFV